MRVAKNTKKMKEKLIHGGPTNPPRLLSNPLLGAATFLVPPIGGGGGGGGGVERLIYI